MGIPTVQLNSCEEPIELYRTNSNTTYHEAMPALVDLSYADIAGELRALAASYPRLASLWTTQQRYGLPSSGDCGRERCKVFVLEVTHLQSHAYHPERPDVLISGALHGDERVGPLATLELARWLLGNYATNEWARRLIHTRRLLLVPMANAVGYARRSRYELDHDPNRDFPFQQAPSRCMTTIAARSINELFRHHLVQLASARFLASHHPAPPHAPTIPALAPLTV